MKRLIISVIALLCVSCGGDDDNSEPPAELIALKSDIGVTQNWDISTGDGIGEQYVKLFLLLVDNKLVTADRDGTITSINADTGSVLWRIQLSETLSGGVGGNRSMVLVASRSGELIAMRNDNGEVLWRRQIISEVLSPPVIIGDRVIARSVDGAVFALDVKTGDQLWTYKRDVPVLTLRGTSIPAIHQGRIFVGLDNGRLVALSVIDGEVLWDVAISVPSGRSEIQRLVDLDGTAVVDHGIIYIVGYQGNVTAVETASGQLLWSRPMSSHSGVTVDANAVYLTDERGHIWALDKTNGATLWKQEQLTARQTSSPVIYGRWLVVGDYQGYVHWMSKENGQFVARAQGDSSGILVPPVIYRQNVLVSGRSGTTMSLSLETASLAKAPGQSTEQSSGHITGEILGHPVNEATDW